jgi:hypothetical protein
MFGDIKSLGYPSKGVILSNHLKFAGTNKSILTSGSILISGNPYIGVLLYLDNANKELRLRFCRWALKELNEESIFIFPDETYCNDPNLRAVKLRSAGYDPNFAAQPLA